MKRAVVLGAGFAGLEAALRLDRLFRAGSDFEVVLVSEQNFFLFTPLLPQITSSYINPRHIVQAVRDLRGGRRFRFQRERVTAIDLGRRLVRMQSGKMTYDYLVVALGSQSNFFAIPGAREYTVDYKWLEDAVVLRERLLDYCEHADHIADPEERRRLLTFIVVGGGYTGVELICEMRDFLYKYVARWYRGIPRNEIRLILLEAGPAILNGIHQVLREHAMRRLRKEGIEIRYNARVTHCFPEGAEINGNEMLKAGTVIWAAGVRAGELAAALPGPHDRYGRAIVNEYMQLGGHPEVFVIGDSAVAESALDAPLVAPVAIEQGRIAANNIAAREHGRPLESYRYASKGMLVSLGMNDAVVDIGPVHIHGYLAWLFWNAVHLYKLVGLLKQFQVAFDWVLGSLFPRDSVIVRRPRSCALCGGAAERAHEASAG